MINTENASLPNVNELIIEKLNAYPDDVRELAIQAIRLSESNPEAAVADQLRTVVLRKIAKQQAGDGQ